MTDRTFTAHEKWRAADRERRMRLRVYPRRVADGRMTQAEADYEIAIMGAIAADCHARIEAEDKQERLAL